MPLLRLTPPFFGGCGDGGAGSSGTDPVTLPTGGTAVFDDSRSSSTKAESAGEAVVMLGGGASAVPARSGEDTETRVEFSSGGLGGCGFDWFTISRDSCCLCLESTAGILAGAEVSWGIGGLEDTGVSDPVVC